MSVFHGRMPLVDLLKAVGAQLIVLHHLAFYGPMSDHVHRWFPGLIDWLYQDARIAVQMFLVVGGFLAARSLAPQGKLLTHRPWRTITQRYRRVTLPYLAALLVCIVLTEIARRWMVHDSIPDRVEFWQFVAHALLLHSVLDVDSLSAGVWYVAIDFQLYVLLVLLLWLGHRLRARAVHMVLGVFALVLLSLFGFNRDPAWDDWAPYFFGAYGMGALAYWCTLPRRQARVVLALGVMAVCTGVALYIDFRTRIAVALAVALLLALGSLRGFLYRWPRSRKIARLSDISYAVFLLNFPVALVFNAGFSRFVPPDPMWQLAGMVLAWLACNGAGALFHDHVEKRLARRR